MRRITLLLAAGVAAMLGCDSGSEPVAVDPLAAQLSQAPEQLSAMPAHTFAIEQVSRGTSQAVGWCNQAAGIVRNAAPGTGTATHIGRFRVEQTGCLNLATGELTGGEAAMTTANGDELYGTWHGTPLPGLTPPTWRLVYVLTGGTGRFTHAEGEMEMRLVMPDQSTWESTGAGWLRYYASDRSGR